MTIQSILADLRIEFAEAGNHHCRPGWIQLAQCPFCHSSNYHLGYNLSLGYFNCWRCGSHHVPAVLIRLGMERGEAWEFWKTNTTSYAPKEKKRAGLKEPGGRTRLLPPHKRYLRGRGFDPDDIVKVWRVEGIGIATRLSWRIYIPIEINEERVSWTTRAIGDVQQRYISASADEEAVNHKTVLYGGDYCLHSVVVTEGPTDAWRVGPGAVALFGTAFSAGQVLKLSKIPHRFICFDNSLEAQQKARELADQLSCFPGETVNLEIDAKDPGSAKNKEIALIRKTAKLY